MSDKNYYSQFGQDQYILETFFSSQMSGTYVDIGAYDGVLISNTYAFAKRGWTGYCIEPLEDIYQQLVKNRPESVCINAIISDSTGESEFLSISDGPRMLSGEMSKYHPDHLKRIDTELIRDGGTKELIRIKSYRFEDVIRHHIVDLLSVDVEGGELDILKSIDYDKYYIKIITVENNYGDPEIAEFMKSVGFDYVANRGDQIFKNRRFLDY
ncbi:methyltransferase, FkbM family [Pedobacter westerhofensis]|uniref:Methyltransferase, FkbM family n=1 Tax=Pedobacter westerhofensis TaxID=425512 RepID=A0A521FR67_9SPHI|nr:FkbM family methyltransferase [Pedobacter westerhofensis]SMO98688.1 methyltransferase, FkbM family [Pedobacter westerhofensis]